MNQMVALAPPMTECFTSQPDFTPFRSKPNQIALDEMNKPAAQLNGEELYWAGKSLEQDLDDVDRADEDTLNRIIWHSVKGVHAPYPAEFAGPHGKGLPKLRLTRATVADED